MIKSWLVENNFYILKTTLNVQALMESLGNEFNDNLRKIRIEKFKILIKYVDDELK